MDDIEDHREDFEYWWRKIGSGITPLSSEDMEEHSKRVACRAWFASIAYIGNYLEEES